MKNTPFRSAHSLPLLRRIADSRILVIVLLTMMFTTQTWAAEPIVWDFAQMEKQETWTEGNTYTIESTDGSKTKMLYTAGGNDAIKDQNNVRCLRQNGTSNGTKRTFELQVPAGMGTLAIEYTANAGKWDITDGQKGGPLLTGYVGGTTSANITVATSLYFTTTSKGYITKITWTPSLPDTYYTFHQGVDGATADTWTIRNLKQVGAGTEWQLSDYTFPAGSEGLSFYVGKNGNFIDGSSV